MKNEKRQLIPIRPRKGRVLLYNPKAWDAEVGDYMINSNGDVYRLEANSSLLTRAAGILYPRTIRPPRPGMKPVKIDEQWFWQKEKETQMGKSMKESSKGIVTEPAPDLYVGGLILLMDFSTQKGEGNRGVPLRHDCFDAFYERVDKVLKVVGVSVKERRYAPQDNGVMPLTLEFAEQRKSSMVIRSLVALVVARVNDIIWDHDWIAWNDGDAIGGSSEQPEGGS
jgi:hypothetical protein